MNCDISKSEPENAGRRVCKVARPAIARASSSGSELAILPRSIRKRGSARVQPLSASRRKSRLAGSKPLPRRGARYAARIAKRYCTET